jgi:hypothetical protein
MINAFVNSPRNFDEIKTLDIYKLHEELERVGDYQKLSKKFKDIVKNLYDGLWNPDFCRHGIYKIGGWKLDFREWMGEFWVEEKYNGIVKYHSFNKVLIRKNAINPSYIIKIVEVG